MNNTALILQSVLRHRIMNSITEMRISTTQFNEETGINPKKIATNLRNLILERVELNEGLMDAAKGAARGIGGAARATARGIGDIASGRNDVANKVGGALARGTKKVGGALSKGIKDIWDGHKTRQAGNREHGAATIAATRQHQRNQNTHDLAMRKTDNKRLMNRDRFAAPGNQSNDDNEDQSADSRPMTQGTFGAIPAAAAVTSAGSRTKEKLRR